MALKKYKPTSPGRRDMTGASFEEITRTAPTKSLLQSKRRHAGRNNSGRVTVRHRGGGHKRRYRLIDFRRDKHGVAARVASIDIPEPLGAHRPAGLRRRREALHHRAAWPSGRRHDPERSQRRDPRRQHAPIKAIRSARWCTTSSFTRSRRAACPRRRTSAQLLAKEAPTRSFACRPAKSAACTKTAWRRSARSATPITATLSSARPAASVGSAGARLYAERRWTPTATRTAVARAARRSGCRGRRRPGASRRVA